MKPPPFGYAAPTSVGDAIGLLDAHAGDEARVLAGGQSLVPLMNFRLAQPGFLVDLQRVEGLDRIELDGDTLVVGAMVRQADAEASPEVALAAPLLAEALGHVADLPIRHSGTVGGNLAHADPAAELPAVALALDAVLTVAGHAGTREVPAAEFFRGPFTTVVEPGEILTGMRVARSAGAGSFVEFTRTHGSFAVVGVATDVEMEGDRIARIRIAMSGVGATPLRAAAAEQALTGTAPDPGSIRAAADATAEALSPAADVHGSAETRRDLARAYLRRGIELALARAQDRR